MGGICYFYQTKMQKEDTGTLEEKESLCAEKHFHSLFWCIWHFTELDQKNKKQEKKKRCTK